MYKRQPVEVDDGVLETDGLNTDGLDSGNAADSSETAIIELDALFDVDQIQENHDGHDHHSHVIHSHTTQEGVN